MWHLNKIPKILHVYFGGKILPYARFMTIYSFHKYNPDWEIRFYFPHFPSISKSWITFEQKYELDVKDYFPELKKLGIRIIPVDFKVIGIDNSISEVHKSDFLRWYLLSTVGGLWSDMDILYFKSINELSFNKPEMKHLDTGVCICNYGHSIGFMLASKHNLYYKYIWERSKEAWNSNNYQSIGSVLSNKLFPKVETIKKTFPTLNPINIPMKIVYAYNASNIKEIFQSTDMGKFTPTSIGLHWYAGHTLAGEFLQKTNGGLESCGDCLPGKILKFINGTPLPAFLNTFIKNNDRVLDIGCGDKKLIKRLKGNHITVDVWEPFKPDVVWDLNKLPLPFPDGMFDIVLMLDVIEHLNKENGKKLLEEVKRITKGKIIIFTPLWWTENLYYMNDINSIYYGNPYEKHQSLWTREDFNDWEGITQLEFIGDYYLGIWRKNVEDEKMKLIEFPFQKIFVTGVSASGKTYYAKEHAKKYNYNYIDYDALYSSPTPIGRAERIISNLFDNFIIDGIPVSTSMVTDELIPFFDYTKKNKIKIVCLYCSNKDRWLYRLHNKFGFGKSKSGLFRYVFLFYTKVISMIKDLDVTFYDTFTNEYTSLEEMNERMSWIYFEYATPTEDFIKNWINTHTYTARPSYQDIECISYKGSSNSSQSWENIQKLIEDKLTFKDKYIVDLGCFHGYFSFKVKQAGAKKVLGLDKLEPAISLANSIQQYVKDEVFFDVWNSDETIPKCDVILLLNALHHFPYPRETLKNMQKCSWVIFEVNESQIDMIQEYFIIINEIKSHRPNRKLLLTKPNFEDNIMKPKILEQLNTEIKNNLIQHFTLTADKKLIPEQSYTVNSFLKSEILKNIKGKRVLDIGCNIGQFSFFAKQAGAKYVLGIDVIKNKGFIDLANRIKEFLRLDIDFKCIDVSDDLLLKGKFDIILCMSVYHYMYHQYRSHDKIFKIFSQMCDELYWENPWGMEDKSCNILFTKTMPEEISNYTKDKILEAALIYFDYKYLGLHGGKTRHTLYMRNKNLRRE